MPEDLESRLTDEGQRDQRKAWNRKLSNLGPASRAAMTDEIYDLRRKNRKARQIITELVAFCEQPDIVAATDGAFDPDATIQAAKRFLSGGEHHG